MIFTTPLNLIFYQLFALSMYLILRPSRKKSFTLTLKSRKPVSGSRLQILTCQIMIMKMDKNPFAPFYFNENSKRTVEMISLLYMPFNHRNQLNLRSDRCEIFEQWQQLLRHSTSGVNCQSIMKMRHHAMYRQVFELQQVIQKIISPRSEGEIFGNFGANFVVQRYDTLTITLPSFFIHEINVRFIMGVWLVSKFFSQLRHLSSDFHIALIPLPFWVLRLDWTHKAHIFFLKLRY